MPKPSSFYNKRYRAKYPDRRNIERKKNYATTSGPERNQNHRAQWTIRELDLIQSRNFTDREIHHFIGRSVQAIQAMRHKLKKA